MDTALVPMMKLNHRKSPSEFSLENVTAGGLPLPLDTQRVHHRAPAKLKKTLKAVPFKQRGKFGSAILTPVRKRFVTSSLEIYTFNYLLTLRVTASGKSR